VLEQADELRTAGAGLTIQINAMRMLESLGLDRAVARAGATLETAKVCRADGSALQVMDLVAVAARFGQPAIALHRRALSQILASALPADAIEFGVAVGSVEQDQHGVTVGLVDGRALHGCAVIGADGIHSAVRRAVFEPVDVRYAGYMCWRGIAPVPTGLPEGHAISFWGAGKRFGLVPIGDEQTYWFATANLAPNGHDGADPRAELLERYAEFCAPVRAVLRATPNSAILRHDISDLPPVARWVDGRVALLGDAAHAMTPNMGQGACQAIEDAVVLGACLSRDPDVPAALRAYEAQRRPRATAFAQRSRRLGKIGQWKGRFAQAVRSMIIRSTSAATLERSVTEMYGVEVPC